MLTNIVVIIEFGYCLFLQYKTIVRISALSFGHSDPDPSSLRSYPAGVLQ